MTSPAHIVAATALLAAAPALVAGCGGGGGSAAPPTTRAAVTTTKIAISQADRPACTLLFARLQRVTVAIRSSSELIARSTNRKQLVSNIHVEQVQLERSADVMTGGPIPAPLAAADRDLVRALHAYARDFGRAHAPAASGDFRAASAAMSDAPVVRRIVRASKTIEDACR